MSCIVIATALLAGAHPAAAAGTRITVSASEFGPMLWGPKRQAIYVFQRDGFKRSRCSGQCAQAWPPVYTAGKPLAGKGARRLLLGTIRRGDGRLQVTYRGRPLYFYVGEKQAGQILCQNVAEFGGLWLVVRASGKLVR